MGSRPMPLILTDAALAHGVEALVAIEPRFNEVLRLVTPTLRRQERGFSTLLWAIVGQQVSVASAEAVWARLVVADMHDPAHIQGASAETLGVLGLTRQKQRYAKALAESGIDFQALDEMSDDEALARLVEVIGIGRWTAEIYLMFAMGRPDVIAAGDLAMQAAAHELFALESRPTEKELRAMSEAWSPWRAVAGRLLWDYYLRDRTKGDQR